MAIKKLLLTLCLLCGICVARAQQYATDPGNLGGDWQLDRVEAKLYSQADHRLIKESTYKMTDSAYRLTAYIPLSLSFSKARCIIKTSRSAEAGSYKLTDSLFIFEHPDLRHTPPKDGTNGAAVLQSQRDVRFRYRQSSPDELVLRSSTLFSRDLQRNEAVSEVYVCFYSRKKQ